MKNLINRSSRLHITFFVFIFSYTFSVACSCPPDSCDTSPTFATTVCDSNVIEVTFLDYTTFGSGPGEFCACGFNMPTEIIAVQSIKIVDASTNIELPQFSFTQNDSTATGFDDLMTGDWEGFSSSVSGTIDSGLDINIIFMVEVSTCNQDSLQNAIAGLNAIGTAGATSGGVPDHHICIPPPPILPIELHYFEGRPLESGIQLSWETLSEINNEYFTIERSINGLDFEEIARIPGAANSNIPIEYNYVDKDPTSGLNYYRLKQTDFDGAYEYSEVISVESRSKDVKLLVFPNPVQTGELALYLPDMDINEVDVSIYNCVGELIHTQTFHTNIMQLDTQHMSKGIYIISMNIKGQSYLEKVILN